jgi:DNA-binding HxlR family transcriptional regulator
MPSKDKKRNTGCPVAFALDTFGDRWSLLVIRDIVLKGAKTYGEFLQANEGIATNVLADRLRELEAEGVITKSRDPENHRKLNYSLTEKGCDLVPVILEMILWSAKYDPKTTARKEILKRIKIDRDGFVEEVRARFSVRS